MNSIWYGFQYTLSKDVLQVPYDVLLQSFSSALDEKKVLSFMETLQNPSTKGSVPPIEVHWVAGREGENYYFTLGGCHRYEAHKRLGLTYMAFKLIETTIEDLLIYLGHYTEYISEPTLESLNLNSIPSELNGMIVECINFNHLYH